MGAWKQEDNCQNLHAKCGVENCWCRNRLWIWFQLEWNKNLRKFIRHTCWSILAVKFLFSSSPTTHSCYYYILLKYWIVTDTQRKWPYQTEVFKRKYLYVDECLVFTLHCKMIITFTPTIHSRVLCILKFGMWDEQITNTQTLRQKLTTYYIWKCI